MENYISIKGKRTELTEEQLRDLGFEDISDGIDEFSEIVRRGDIRKHYKVNDIITLAGQDYKLIGIDHDRKTGGGVHQNNVTLMSMTLLDPRRMHSDESDNGYKGTELREWLNKDYFKSLPENLREHILTIDKTTHNYKGEKIETRERVFIPSESELFGSAIYSDYEDGERYEAFSTSENRQLRDKDGDYWYYWTRSQCNSTGFASVGNGGNATYAYASSATLRVPVCFCFS